MIVCILTIISIMLSFCSCVRPSFLAVSVRASLAASSFYALKAVDAFAAAAWTSAAADLNALSKAVVSLLTFVPPQPPSSNGMMRNAMVNNPGSFVFIGVVNSGFSAILCNHSRSVLCIISGEPKQFYELPSGLQHVCSPLQQVKWVSEHSHSISPSATRRENKTAQQSASRGFCSFVAGACGVTLPMK